MLPSGCSPPRPWAPIGISEGWVYLGNQGCWGGEKGASNLGLFHEFRGRWAS